MRVLEKEIVSPYNMGKKNKHKLRKSKENEASDSSEEVSAKGCAHVNKAVNFNAMRKGLSKQTFGECATCAKDVVRKGEPKTLMDHLEGATSSDFTEDVEPTIWVCLQCGHQGCGRTSPEKHALKHFETPRSSQHSVVINLSNYAVWCYDCDDELAPEKYKKVAECVEHIKKLAYVPVTDITQGKNSNSGGSSDAAVNKSRPVSGKTASAGCNKVKGLSNLGNTCFFNAVMQNLVQTYSLENLLWERKKGHPLKLQGHSYLDPDSCSSSDEGENEKNQKNIVKDLTSIEVSTSDPGPLTHALVVFLHDINTTSRSGCINPSALFGQVCKKAPRFKGMQQQDSHELLRYLLDNMKTEEIKRGQSGILKYFKLSENTNPKKVDEETKYKVKAYGQEIKHTFVECLFGGQLISTVVCEECKFISQILEPFLDLSLPVTEEKPQRPNQLMGRKKDGGQCVDVKEEKTGLHDGILVAKDDKPSKYQNKKQKKRQKRDARRQGKNKVNPLNGEKGEEDQDEREEENEEKEGADGEKNEQQEEKWDDSDADVEDNLESDTSRCYKSLSDSVVASLDSPEKSVTSLNDTMHLSSQSIDSPAVVTTFNVETKIENHSCTVDNLVENGETTFVKLNGPVELEAETGAKSGDFTVSYTLRNGNLLENSQDVSEYIVGNSMDANVTFSCIIPSNEVVDAPEHGHESICNGDLRNSDEFVNDVKDRNHAAELDSSEPQSHQATEALDDTSKLVNGDTERNTKMDRNVVDERTDSLPNGKVSPENPTEVTSLTDITSEISTLSFGDSTSTLASDLSKLTLKDEVVKDIVNETKDSLIETSHTVNETGNLMKDAVEESKECTENKDGISVLTSKMCNGHSLPNGDIGESHQTHCRTSSVSSLSSLHMSKQGRLKELQKEGKKRSINTLAERYHPSSGECSVQSCLHQFTAAELLTGNNKFGCKNCTKLKYKNNPNKDKKETVYSNANKQYLIFQPPAVLTLHLKRFEQVGFSSRKVNRHVDFPFILDVAPYCSSLSQGIKSGQKKILYSLYGVVEHSGRLTSGHYTAYVKVRANVGTLNNFLNKHNVTLKEYLNTYAQTVIKGDLQDTEAADGVNTDGLVPPGRWYHISDSRVNEVTEASVERAQAYLLFYERIY